MKRLLLITDLTRMQEERVCIAGYDQDGNCIRPVLPPPGIHESTLYSQGRPAVFPFAVVEYDLLEPRPHPPHTEDYRYDPKSVRFIERADEKRKREVLTKTLFQNVSAVFEVPIFSDFGYYVMEGQGPRSLGTIQPSRVMGTFHGQSPDGNWEYRLGFVDGSGTTYWLTVTDLAWRYYHDCQHKEGYASKAISSSLTSALRSSEVYLRVGLARGWEKFPDRCFLQITGVHTFPDYLKGQTFADLASALRQHG
jgi:hypothetical protein